MSDAETYLRLRLAEISAEPGFLLLIDRHGAERWLAHGPFAAKLLAEPGSEQWAGRTVRFVAAADEAKAWRAACYEWPMLGA